ncbi:MAG: hypothetical protein ACQEV0_13885 [Bacillota bacterium]
MENNNEMIKFNIVNYERFIKGYQQYKAERTGQHREEEGERYDNSSRVEQAQR